MFACHGSPAGGDLEYLLEDVSSGHAVLALDGAIKPRLAGIQHARVVLCGHTHIARVVTSGGTLIVNPGSVGMPAYHDDHPVPHDMEAGSPHARYAILTRSGDGWSAALRAVPYDHEAAARQAERHGRPATAFGVRTGRVPRRAKAALPPSAGLGLCWPWACGTRFVNRAATVLLSVWLLLRCDDGDGQQRGADPAQMVR